MTPSEPLLQVRDLRVDVGDRNILKSVSLDIPAGALLVLMGLYLALGIMIPIRLGTPVSRTTCSSARR